MTGPEKSHAAEPHPAGADGQAHADALAQLGEWPVDHVAGAVVTPAGLSATFGSTDRRFPLASVSKPVFATAVLVAVEEETLSLGTPAGPDGSTVEHLLSHASGLALDGGELARPGRRRIYSNTGFEVLGQTLGSACGFDVATYLTEAVLGPLGMNNTSLDGSPASEITSTVDDLARWVAELFAPTVLASATVERARTVSFPGLDGMVPGYGKQSPNDWGLGFEIKAGKDPHWTAPDGSPRTYGHFGRSGTLFWVDPDAEVALIVLTDREFGGWTNPLWPDLGRAVLAATTALRP